ncbi:L-rhamnose mutarotase [Abyssalbus ytuae]|uniref:L-rhamnose mutarotase n=2 Tax=Abyssalbus ytuae TaxID=2926907 RepID=A0A9E6ZL59_9FLAO|nr:L-rhamnose mutarotase [Abyssalbus ytuae]
MKLKPGNVDEYKKRHDAIWPELKQVLSEAGISDYSIFLDENSLTLFAFQKIKIPNQVTTLHKHPLMKKWWAYMADLMETNTDLSPVVHTLEEVFHMD